VVDPGMVDPGVPDEACGNGAACWALGVGGAGGGGAAGAGAGDWAPAGSAAMIRIHAMREFFMARTIPRAGGLRPARQPLIEPRRMTATVNREVHTSLPPSSTMSMTHTWVRPPKCTGRAVPVTSPERAERT